VKLSAYKAGLAGYLPASRQLTPFLTTPKIMGSVLKNLILEKGQDSIILILCHEKGKTLLSRAIKINITLPEDELGRIDRYTKEEGTTRSGLILRALRSYMKRKEEQAAEKMRRLAIQKTSSDIKKLRVKAGKWNGVAEIRKWRDLK
jgi:hypothetical protein